MAQEEYLAGNKETLDVLSAEQDNFSAEVELLNSEQEEVKQAFSILEAIGILRALYLNLDVQIYEPLQEEKKIPFWGLGIGEPLARSASVVFCSSYVQIRASSSVWIYQCSLNRPIGF